MTARPMPLRFYLCPSCRDTWTGARGDDWCHWCARFAVDCSPWGGDGRAWFHARMQDDDATGLGRRADEVAEARYRPEAEMRASLDRGIVDRGREMRRAS